MGLHLHFFNNFGLNLDIFRLIKDIFGPTLEVFEQDLSAGFGSRGQLPNKLRIISRYNIREPKKGQNNMGCQIIGTKLSNI